MSAYHEFWLASMGSSSSKCTKPHLLADKVRLAPVSVDLFVKLDIAQASCGVLVQ